MKHLKIFEEIINPQEYNKNIYFEENEEEEDDIFNIDSEYFINEPIYKAEFIFYYINNKDGEISEKKYKDMYYNYNYYNMYNLGNFKFYNIKINIEKLIIKKITSTKIFFSNGKNTYSMNLDKFLHDNKLYNFYIRQYDILAFDINGIKEGLNEFIENKNFKKLFRYCKEKSIYNEKIKIEKEIIDLNKKINNIEFLKNNIDNIKPYISILFLNNDYNKIKNTLEIKKNNFKNLKELDDNDLDIYKLIDNL